MQNKDVRSHQKEGVGSQAGAAFVFYSSSLTFKGEGLPRVFDTVKAPGLFSRPTPMCLIGRFLDGQQDDRFLEFPIRRLFHYLVTEVGRNGTRASHS